MTQSLDRTKESDFNDVGDFHQKFGLDNVTHYLAGPREVDRHTLKFRILFLLEELLELMEACGVTLDWDSDNETWRLILPDDLSSDTIDHAKAFDALIDLNYVSHGTAHLLGYPWSEGWDLVQEANMNKQRAQSADESARGSQLDVIKPPGWQPPAIEALLTMYGYKVPLTIDTPEDIQENDE